MRDAAIAILVLAIFVVACDKSPADTGPPPGLQPIAVRVDGPTQVTPPAEVQFTALQTWSDGSTRDVTARAQWTSTNPSVLSVNAGLARALAGGEVGLTAQLEQLTSQPKSVRVVPSIHEWDGTYTLTLGGGACNESLPLPPELRQRRYEASVRQVALALDVYVYRPHALTGVSVKVGSLGGQILNPQVRFYFTGARTFARPMKRASVMEVPDGIRLVRYEPRAYLFGYRRFVYDGTELLGLEEVVPDGNRLVITGQALTTMSPSGFTGTLNGALSLYERSRSTLLGVCSSSSHGFTLVRK